MIPGMQSPMFQFASLALSLARHRFARFLAIGLCNTAFGYGVFFLALRLTDHAILAAFVSTVAGVIFNFRSTGALVFGSREGARFTRFIGVYAFLFVVNAGALAALGAMRISPAVAQAGLLPALASLSYLLNRDLVFRSSATGEAR